MSPPSGDHYQVLGVPRDAVLEQIRAAYRALARRLHPDVSRAPDAQARFVCVQAAYDVLCDAERRAAYDLTLDSAGRNGAGRAHYSWTNIARDQSRTGPAARTEFDEMYEAFFGSGGAGGAGGER